MYEDHDKFARSKKTAPMQHAHYLHFCFAALSVKLGDPLPMYENDILYH
jgi:hypothetical protein